MLELDGLPDLENSGQWQSGDSCMLPGQRLSGNEPRRASGQVRYVPCKIPMHVTVRDLRTPSPCPPHAVSSLTGVEVCKVVLVSLLS
jgi:hypothetical protein